MRDFIERRQGRHAGPWLLLLLAYAMMPPAIDDDIWEWSILAIALALVVCACIEIVRIPETRTLKSIGVALFYGGSIGFFNSFARFGKALPEKETQANICIMAIATGALFITISMMLHNRVERLKTKDYATENPAL
jgi:hypothetical protein